MGEGAQEHSPLPPSQSLTEKKGWALPTLFNFIILPSNVKSHFKTDFCVILNEVKDLNSL